MSPIPLVAQIDYLAGKISMPLDHYDVSREDNAIVATANDLAMSRCMAVAGQGSYFPFYDRRRVSQDTDWRYGVWVKSQVARYGYQKPPPSKLEQTLRAANATKFSPAANEAYGKCITVVHNQGLAYRTPPDGAADDTTTPDVMDSPAAKVVLNDWRTCLTGHGVSAPGDDFMPRGIRDAPLEEQIRVGLIDVDCKKSTNMIQRLGDLDARAEGPFIIKHEAQLVETLKNGQSVVQTARTYLAEHPAKS